MKSTVPKAASRRLLYDRRYGWVVDEWRDPSAEALAGGRGMFCMVPLAKTLLKMASQSVQFTVTVILSQRNFPDNVSELSGDDGFPVNSKEIHIAASSAVKVIEKPDLFSPHALQATLGHQLEKFKSFHLSNCVVVKGNSLSAVADGDDSLHTHSKNRES